MKAEDESKIPDAIKDEHRNRRLQSVNLHTCGQLAKSKIAKLEATIDQIEQQGDPAKIRELHLAIEAEKLYSDLLLQRQSVITKTYAKSCEAYNLALARTAECWGCKYLHVELNNPVKFCSYGCGLTGNVPAVPVGEIKICPNQQRQ